MQRSDGERKEPLVSAPKPKELTPKDRENLNDIIAHLSAGGELDSYAKRRAKLILDGANLTIVKYSIPADKTFGSVKEEPTEWAQLNGMISPLRAYTSDEIKQYSSPGKQSVLMNMVKDNIDSLPSLRGQAIYFIVSSKVQRSLATAPYPFVEIKHQPALLATLISEKDKQVSLLGSVLDQCYPKMRSRLDWANPLAYINWLFSRISQPLERGLYTVGSLIAIPFHEARKKYKAAEGGYKVAWGAAVFFTAILCSPGQIFNLAGNLLRYTRHLVNGLSNFVSSGYAAIKDKVTKSHDYGTKYPTVSVCLKAIGKSLLFLIPTAIVLGLCFIPGMAVVPAVAVAVAKLPIVYSVLAWIGISMATPVAMQAASGGLRKAVIVSRDTPSTVMLGTVIANENKSPKTKSESDRSTTAALRVSRRMYDRDINAARKTAEKADAAQTKAEDQMRAAYEVRGKAALKAASSTESSTSTPSITRSPRSSGSSPH